MSTPDGSGPSDQILSEAYPQLRRIAARFMAGQKSDHTLQATALVHEAWLHLSVHKTRSWWGNGTRLCAAAATTMRRILIDRARLRASVKRGGEWERASLESVDLPAVTADEKMILVHEALNALEREDPLHARVVALKFFGGLSNHEVAQEMAVTERTVERYWAHAKAWLYDQILLCR